MNLRAADSEAFGAIIHRSDKYSVSTLEIAEICEKRHGDVLKAVCHLFEMLQIENPAETGFYVVDSYLDGSGRKVPFYRLSKLAALTLLAGYEAKMRLSIIDFLLGSEVSA